MSHRKLTSEEKELLRLIDRSPHNEDRWCECSEILWRFVLRMPRELVESQSLENKNYVRLTDIGKAIIYWT